MSDNPLPQQEQPKPDRGTIVTSIMAQATFVMALAAAVWLAWFTQQYEPLILMLGIAGTNATTIVNYWVGSSAGSARKDLMRRPIP